MCVCVGGGWDTVLNEKPGTQLVLNQCPLIPFFRREKPGQKRNEETTTKEEKQSKKQPEERGPGWQEPGIQWVLLTVRSLPKRMKTGGKGEAEEAPAEKMEAVMEGDSVGKAVGIQ